MCTPTECRYLSQASRLLVALSPTGNIRRVDPRRSTALGRDVSALAGKPLADLLADGQRNHLARILARARSSPAVWEPLTFVAADGRPETLLCCFQPLKGADAPRGGVLVTGLKLAELESDLMAEAATALGQMAFRCHGPAHRLMQTIEAVLAEHPKSKAAARCRTDLDGLLDALSQSAAWPAEYADGRPVDVIRLIQGALRVIDRSPEFKPLKVVLRPECPSAWARVHPAGMAFVTLHLVSNARDAAAARSPRLFIAVGADAGRVTVEFHDNGAGIDREDLGCVFSPGFSKAPHKGAHVGVGLTTCNELVRFMGGRIRMRSRPTQGTTVIVTFPAAAPPD